MTVEMPLKSCLETTVLGAMSTVPQNLVVIPLLPLIPYQMNNIGIIGELVSMYLQDRYLRSIFFDLSSQSTHSSVPTFSIKYGHGDIK
jgi:hypothetical protein